MPISCPAETIFLSGFQISLTGLALQGYIGVRFGKLGKQYIRIMHYRQEKNKPNEQKNIDGFIHSYSITQNIQNIETSLSIVSINQRYKFTCLQIKFHRIYIHESKVNESKGATYIHKHTSASTRHTQEETSFSIIFCCQLKLQASLQGCPAVDI